MRWVFVEKAARMRRHDREGLTRGDGGGGVVGGGWDCGGGIVGGVMGGVGGLGGGMAGHVCWCWCWCEMNAGRVVGVGGGRSSAALALIEGMGVRTGVGWDGMG